MSNEEKESINLLREGLDVSRETIEALETYYNLLVKWQKAQNLVSRETLDLFWSRHVCDSASLKELCPEAAIWLDMGSGAGFPGLVVAILQRENPNGKSYLIESNMRKVAFLRSVIRELGLNATVIQGRLESIIPTLEVQPTYISARALTSLPNLLDLTHTLIVKGSKCYFHKGEIIDSEIKDAQKSWSFNFKKHHPKLSKNILDSGVIVEIDAISKINHSV